MLLDIVIPHYGPVDYLIGAVESVLREDSDKFRLTVVDDASPGERVRAYLDSVSDDRFRYVRNERNLGLALNFQRALDLVGAPHFAMMGCDDLLLPGYIKSFEEALTINGWEVFQPGVVVIDEAGHQVTPLADRVKSLIRPRANTDTGPIPAAQAVRSLCIGDWLYFPSLCWNTQSARSLGFRTDLHVALDLQLVLGVLVRGGRLLVGSQPVFAYRRHGASASAPVAGDGARFAEEATIYEEARTTFRDLGWTSAARMARTPL